MVNDQKANKLSYFKRLPWLQNDVQFKLLTDIKHGLDSGKRIVHN